MTEHTSPDDDLSPLGPDGHARRAFLKRMAAAGFVVPAVASFSVISRAPAFAGVLGSGGNQTTTTTTTTTTLPVVTIPGGGGNQGAGGNSTTGPLPG